MATDDSAADDVVEGPRLPDDLGSPRLRTELAEAVHAALRAAQQGWVARQARLDLRAGAPPGRDGGGAGGG